ncbi:MAG TPA: hypothetical protein VLB50_06360 [Ignavibacteriaceae bacterium]|nr:hypothetical protein [Ignavibacteriaceae bacterium]
MERKYIVPAITLIAGVLIWVFFLLFYSRDEITPASEVSLGIITGGLLVFSAYRCRRVGGPKGGNIFRASLLFIVAVLSFWMIGITSAILMLGAAAVILFLALKKSEPSRMAEV